MEIEAIAREVVDCGFKVHAGLDPGLLESVCERVSSALSIITLISRLRAFACIKLNETPQSRVIPLTTSGEETSGPVPRLSEGHLDLIEVHEKLLGQGC